MVAIWLPQRHVASGSLTRKPMMGEVEDGADDGGDEHSKRSSCNMDVTFILTGLGSSCGELSEGRLIYAA
jgi:hypothetical protein